MIIGKVTGSVVSTRKNERLIGSKFMVVQPVSGMGDGKAIVAVDNVGAGIGEHVPYIRANSLSGLEYLGVKLDESRNTFGHSSTPVKISADDSKVAVYMIPTNEELVIAKDTDAIVSALK